MAASQQSDYKPKSVSLSFSFDNSFEMSILATESNTLQDDENEAIAKAVISNF